MQWFIFVTACCASGAMTGVVVYRLTLRLSEGWLLNLLTILIMVLFSCTAFFLTVPADHGQHQTWTSLLNLWPMVSGFVIGRGEARKRLAKREKDEAEASTLVEGKT